MANLVSYPRASRCALVPGLYVTSRIRRSGVSDPINAVW
jgi:hypothetical protein